VSVLQAAVERLVRLGGAGGQPDDIPKKAGPVKLGAGLASVPTGLAGKIRREEYVDLAKLPPALPDGASIGTQMSEQLLIVQAAN